MSLSKLFEIETNTNRHIVVVKQSLFAYMAYLLFVTTDALSMQVYGIEINVLYCYLYVTWLLHVCMIIKL